MLLRRWLSISSWSGKASGLLVTTQSQELLSKGGLGPGGHSAGRPFSAGFSLKCGFRERLLFRNGHQAALLSSWGPSRPPPALPRQVSPSSGTTAGCEGGRDMQPAQGGGCGIGSHHRGRESKGRSRPRQIRLCPQSLGRGPRSSECGESLKWGWAAAWAWVRLGQETSESSRPAPALQLRLSVGQSLRGRARAPTAREKRGSQNTEDGFQSLVTVPLGTQHPLHTCRLGNTTLATSCLPLAGQKHPSHKRGPSAPEEKDIKI